MILRKNFDRLFARVGKEVFSKTSDEVLTRNSDTGHTGEKVAGLVLRNKSGKNLKLKLEQPSGDAHLVQFANGEKPIIDKRSPVESFELGKKVIFAKAFEYSYKSLPRLFSDNVSHRDTIIKVNDSNGLLNANCNVVTQGFISPVFNFNKNTESSDYSPESDFIIDYRTSNNCVFYIKVEEEVYPIEIFNDLGDGLATYFMNVQLKKLDKNLYGYINSSSTITHYDGTEVITLPNETSPSDRKPVVINHTKRVMLGRLDDEKRITLPLVTMNTLESFGLVYQIRHGNGNFENIHAFNGTLNTSLTSALAVKMDKETFEEVSDEKVVTIEDVKKYNLNTKTLDEFMNEPLKIKIPKFDDLENDRSRFYNIALSDYYAGYMKVSIPADKICKVDIDERLELLHIEISKDIDLLRPYIIKGFFYAKSSGSGTDLYPAEMIRAVSEDGKICSPLIDTVSSMDKDKLVPIDLIIDETEADNVLGMVSLSSVNMYGLQNINGQPLTFPESSDDVDGLNFGAKQNIVLTMPKFVFGDTAEYHDNLDLYILVEYGFENKVDYSENKQFNRISSHGDIVVNFRNFLSEDELSSLPDTFREGIDYYTGKFNLEQTSHLLPTQYWSSKTKPLSLAMDTEIEGKLTQTVLRDNGNYYIKLQGKNLKPVFKGKVYETGYDKVDSKISPDLDEYIDEIPDVTGWSLDEEKRIYSTSIGDVHIDQYVYGPMLPTNKHFHRHFGESRNKSITYNVPALEINQVTFSRPVITEEGLEITVILRDNLFPNFEDLSGLIETLEFTGNIVIQTETNDESKELTINLANHSDKVKKNGEFKMIIPFSELEGLSAETRITSDSRYENVTVNSSTRFNKEFKTVYVNA